MFKVSVSGYYSWQQSTPARLDALERLKVRIKKLFETSRSIVLSAFAGYYAQKESGAAIPKRNAR